MFGLFLAWSTRYVTIPVLNDSHYIGMSVYNIVILSIVGVVVSTALDGTIHSQASVTVTCLCILVSTAVTMFLVFVPKVSRQYSGKDMYTSLHEGSINHKKKSNNFEM